MNINEIAKLAGVSRATVSRYLNDGYISLEKRERIAKVIKETGYVPSRQAKTLRTGKSGLIAVIIPKINSVSVSRMVAGISEVLGEKGLELLLASTDNDAEKELDYLRIFTQKHNVDGLILIATILDEAHKKALQSLSLPHIVLGQRLKGSSCVYYDDFNASKTITLHALERGTKPAYIGVTTKDESAGLARLEGYKAALLEKGIAFDPQAYIESGFSLDEGYLAAEELLHTYRDMDTLICASDNIAFSALTCLREYGIKVPEEVQVTGIGDNDMAKVVVPSLTSVHHHYKTAGREAARMLIEAMELKSSQKQNTQIVKELCLGFELLTRGSTR